jgi:serpin B
MVELPYGEKSTHSMTVVLPDDVSSFVNKLTYTQMLDYLSDLREKEGTLLLPRFKTEFTGTLNDSLQELGMQKAFSNGAEFSGMSANPTKIDEVKHKTFLEVNEEGSEAAAVTSVGGAMITSVGESDNFFMEVNKPFFIIIRENKSGIPLFMGAINTIN